MDTDKDFVDIDENGNIIHKTFLEKLKGGFKKVTEFCKYHPTEAITIGSIMASVLLEGVKWKRLNVAKKDMERRIYDRKEGRYLRTKRALTNREWREVSKEKLETGKSVFDILYDKNLLSDR